MNEMGNTPFFKVTRLFLHNVLSEHGLSDFTLIDWVSVVIELRLDIF